MGLKAIFFDMGGTIDTFRFTRQYRVEQVPLVRDCLQKAGITTPNVSDEQLADMITQGAAAYTRWNMVSNTELSAPEIWSRYFLKDLSILEETLQPIGEELALIYETRLYIREMRKEVPLVLSQIRSLGLKIGCISNTQSTSQVPLNLEQYGIKEFFDPIVLSSEYGRRKPDPSIFYYAARLANLPSSHCAYVGDKINRDILGARRAGYRLAVQIKHPYDNGEVDEGATPDAVITSLEELLPLLKEYLAEKVVEPCKVPSLDIQAVFFDAGDILYHRPNRGSHLKQFLENKKTCPQPDMDAEKRRLKELAYTGQIRRHAYYEALIRLYGITDPSEIEEGIQAIAVDDDSVEIIEGVPQTIRELKSRGFLLGIITDTAMPYSKKLNWFDANGFGDVWDTVISSRELGQRKPAATLYELALSQAGVSPCQSVFIGHKPSELDGARAMGMHTIAFNYEPGAQADLFIERFPDLLNLDLLRRQ